MDTLLQVTLPVFALIAFGWVSARLFWLPADSVAGLSAFVFNIAIPVMLFHAMVNTTLPTSLPWYFLIAYFASTFAVYGLGILFAGPRRFADRVMTGMASSYSNVVLLGIPLVLQAYGEAAQLPLFVLVATHPAVMFCLTTLLAEPRTPGVRLLGSTVQVLVKNPVFSCLVAGVAFNLLGWKLPATIDVAAGLLGDAALPCAVFSIGASLAAFRLRGNLRQVAVAVVLKNLVHPLLVAGLCLEFALPPLWTAVAVTLAAAPTGINVYVFAHRYAAPVEAIASTIVVSTVVSIVGISLVLALFAAT